MKRFLTVTILLLTVIIVSILTGCSESSNGNLGVDDMVEVSDDNLTPEPTPTEDPYLGFDYAISRRGGRTLTVYKLIDWDNLLMTEMYVRKRVEGGYLSTSSISTQRIEGNLEDGWIYDIDGEDNLRWERSVDEETGIVTIQQYDYKGRPCNTWRETNIENAVAYLKKGLHGSPPYHVLEPKD